MTLLSRLALALARSEEAKLTPDHVTRTITISSQFYKELNTEVDSHF